MAQTSTCINPKMGMSVLILEIQGASLFPGLAPRDLAGSFQNVAILVSVKLVAAERSQRIAYGGFWRARAGSSTRHPCFHFIDRVSVSWTLLPTAEAGKCLGRRRNRFAER